MTNQELKLRCYELVGDLPLITGNRMEDAKQLYEWVTEKHEATIQAGIKNSGKVFDTWIEEVREKGLYFKDIPPVEVELSPDQKTVAAKLREESSNLEDEERIEVNSIGGHWLFNVVTKKDTIEFNYKGEDIIVCRSWEHIPEDRGGKTAFWVTRVFEDEGITTKIKFI